MASVWLAGKRSNRRGKVSLKCCAEWISVGLYAIDMVVLKLVEEGAYCLSISYL